MWLEAKALITTFAVIFIAIVISQIILINVFLGFLLFMGVFLMIFGDIVYGWQVCRSRVNKLIDKPPPGKVVALIHTLNGMVDFEWATKGPYGKREFVYNKREASIIDQGDYPIHFPNGSLGFVCHEKSADAIDMRKVKYAESLAKSHGTNNIKEIYYKIKGDEIGGE